MNGRRYPEPVPLRTLLYIRTGFYTSARYSTLTLAAFMTFAHLTRSTLM